MSHSPNNLIVRNRDWAWAIGLGLFWIAMVITGIVVERITGQPMQMCMFKRVTGLPCATCGSTRAVRALVEGDPLRAITMNPLVVALLAIAPVYVLVRWLRPIPQQRARWSSSQQATAWIVCVALFAANWVYVIWRGN